MGQARLQQLLKQQEQLQNRIKAEQAKARTRARKEDTRRKIIVGALALEHAEQHPGSPFAQELARLLHTHVTRPQDRALLDLPDTQDNAPASTSDLGQAFTRG